MAYCDRCERSFPHRRALHQHERDSDMHHKCDACRRDFASSQSLEQHWINSAAHFYCGNCEEHFDDCDELNEHYDKSHYFCTSCEIVYWTESDLHEHYSESHHWCSSCERLFQSESNLNAHLGSRIHVKKSSQCGCGRAFVSPAALILHYEAGSCKSGMTRQRLNDFVRTIDTTHIITLPFHLIEDSGSHVETWATERSWNGEAYECYFCPSTFHTLRALNQHLRSPRHQEKVYICPKTDCRQEFAVLSGLCQHIESGKCGIARFRQVRTVMDNIANGAKRITLG
ncbi:hypothetical protein BOTBODRAFT_57607 [Botryobasidium botryosum FD-172 SS1]|uniref:C2H2-type domain-containing protein n=1 Tax=Botryobasidium botryosum (strain FD-172 SS1) TaxID=930990 RepID=A0A067M670_BOTB1|nr:hypothetical protein BOTBODRAFT_57607 [Botryobasidium botryosum FD-172 SS1]